MLYISTEKSQYLSISSLSTHFRALFDSVDGLCHPCNDKIFEGLLNQTILSNTYIYFIFLIKKIVFSFIRHISIRFRVLLIGMYYFHPAYAEFTVI